MWTFYFDKYLNTPEQLKSILEDIIAVPTGNDFVTFEIKDVAPISVAKKYAGIGALSLPISKIQERRLALTLALEMSLFRNRKSAESQRSFQILNRQW